MTKLSGLLAIEDEAVKQAAIKKMFMPYTEGVCVDGFEKEALTILLNLSSSHQAIKPIGALIGWMLPVLKGI